METSKGILAEGAINEKLRNGSLVISPLLEPSQVSKSGIDFRLGYDFLVSVQGRDPFINVSKNIQGNRNGDSFQSFFQPTRRQMGETFILHPHQTVLAATLEYVKMPNDIAMMLFLRSSYARLGLTVNTLVQPGFCGCISIELTNGNHVPINLSIGARLLHAVLMPTETTNYLSEERKYLCHVRPELSAASQDADLDILKKIYQYDTL